MSYRSRNTALAASLLAALLAIAQADTATAQANAALEQCVTIKRDSARLACYDELLRPAPQSAAAEPPDMAGDPQQREGERGSVSAQAPAADAEPQQRRNGLFSRRRNRDADRSDETVVIVDVRTSISDLRVFTTQDGRVFSQTSTNTIQYNEPPFNALIEPASFGSFFLTPEGNRRGVRVSLRE